MKPAEVHGHSQPGAGQRAGSSMISSRRSSKTIDDLQREAGVPDPLRQHCKGGRRERHRREALDAATALFAANGYEHTSLTDLTAVMGITKPSLYRLFGNKEELYLKALERYSDLSAQRLARSASQSTARAAVEHLLRGCVEMLTDPRGAGACFVTQGPLHTDEVSMATREQLAQQRSSLVNRLQTCFDDARAVGDLPPDTDTEKFAKYYAVLIQGLALEVRHGGECDVLLGIVDLAMEVWPRTSG